jgi:hypothetical protein
MQPPFPRPLDPFRPQREKAPPTSELRVGWSEGEGDKGSLVSGHSFQGEHARAHSGLGRVWIGVGGVQRGKRGPGGATPAAFVPCPLSSPPPTEAATTSQRKCFDHSESEIHSGLLHIVSQSQHPLVVLVVGSGTCPLLGGKHEC